VLKSPHLQKKTEIYETLHRAPDLAASCELSNSIIIFSLSDYLLFEKDCSKSWLVNILSEEQK